MADALHRITKLVDSARKQLVTYQVNTLEEHEDGAANASSSLRSPRSSPE